MAPLMLRSEQVQCWLGLRLPRRCPVRAAQVDAERFGGAEGVLVELTDLDLLAVPRSSHADVEAERLHLLDEHLEGLGDSRFGDVLALDDRLVDLHTAAARRRT